MIKKQKNKEFEKLLLSNKFSVNGILQSPSTETIKFIEEQDKQQEIQNADEMFVENNTERLDENENELEDRCEMLSVDESLNDTTIHSGTEEESNREEHDSEY